MLLLVIWSHSPSLSLSRAYKHTDSTWLLHSKIILTEMVSATRKRAVNPRRCVQYVLTEWQTKLQLETSNWDHCDLQPTAACEIKKRIRRISTERHLRNLPCTLSPARDMQLKSASLRNGFVANSDRAPTLCTRVYISKQALGWGSKKSKVAEQTESSTHTYATLTTCEQWSAEGAVTEGWGGVWWSLQLVLLRCGAVLGSFRVTLPAPRLCGGAWYAGSSPRDVGSLWNRSRSGVDSLSCE